MKTVNDMSRRAVLFPLAGAVLLFLYSGSVPCRAAGMPATIECGMCHAERMDDIARAGGKHRSVPCIGCHVGHPPEVQKPIAPCGKCHAKTKKAHFSVNGCLDCHQNPHTPLKIQFKAKNECFNCHGAETELIRKGTTKHSAVGCATCHDVHRKIPQCTQCHKPHAPEMSAAECKKCHSPHQPLPVKYSAKLPSADCGACHANVLSLLASSKVKHQALQCVFCHQEKHGMVPQCQSCHGAPHPAGIMRKFPKCGACHKIAHDLNNWAPAGPGATSAP